MDYERAESPRPRRSSSAPALDHTRRRQGVSLPLAALQTRGVSVPCHPATANNSTPHSSCAATGPSNSSPPVRVKKFAAFVAHDGRPKIVPRASARSGKR